MPNTSGAVLQCPRAASGLRRWRQAAGGGGGAALALGRCGRTWTATVRRLRVASLAGAVKARVAVQAARAILLGCCSFHTSGAKRAGCGHRIGRREEGAPGGRSVKCGAPHLLLPAGRRPAGLVWTIRGGALA